jgi:hypothetical protein
MRETSSIVIEVAATQKKNCKGKEHSDLLRVFLEDVLL